MKRWTRTTTLLISLFVLLLAPGCGDDGGGGDGPRLDMDVTPALPDGGDTAAREDDVGGEPGCAPQPLVAPAPESLPRCSEATAACVWGCDEADADCPGECLGRDSTGPDPASGLDCGLCVTLTFLTCAQEGGCGDAVRDWQCCVQATCEGTTGLDCVRAGCQDELDAAFACSYEKAPACLVSLYSDGGGCFPAGDGPDPTCTAVPVEHVPADALPRCAAETASCVADCAADDADCPETCLAYDPTPADETHGYTCALCMSTEYLACLEDGGCGEAVWAYQCCLERECAADTSGTCWYTACLDELGAAHACDEEGALGCSDGYAAPASPCFP